MKLGMVYRPKIVIGHPFLGRGGSEARVMWLIESLKQDYDLTVVTTGGWDLEDLNRAYNTNVQEQDVSVLFAPTPRVLRRYSAAALRGAYFQRFCRSIARDFDLCISAYNCTDWGCEALHFIADFTWSDEITSRATGRSPGFIYRDTIMRRSYLSLAKRIARPSSRDPLREDQILPTSHWGAALLKRNFGATRVEALYPFLHSPARTGIDREALCKEEIPFISIGRIAAEKRIEDTIEIVRALRQQGFPVHLYLAGEIGSDQYGTRIRESCLKNSAWVSVLGRVSGARKQDLFSAVAYGISTCRQELFGNAVAEMMCGGIIPFVYEVGGPAELVGSPALTFGNNEQAVDKIVHILKDAELRSSIRKHLQLASKVFSLETTISKVRSIVKSAIDSKSSASVLKA